MTTCDTPIVADVDRHVAETTSSLSDNAAPKGMEAPGSPIPAAIPLVMVIAPVPVGANSL